MPQLKQPKIVHSPNLDTVLMVEDTIRSAKQVVGVAELKRRLPRKVNHTTLKVILAYLQKSGKIEFTPDGAVWIFMPREDIAGILNKGRTWS
jgi:hypothetical protein